MVIRAHVVLPEDVLSELDEIVGPRGRSQYITEAIREKLLRDKQRRVLSEYAGVLADEDIPHWATPELTTEWINEGRRDNRELPDPPEL